MSSKNEDLYIEVFTQLIRLIKSHSNFNNLADIKIMYDLGLRRAIKAIFPQCILDGCYFHYCKAIWKKIKKLHLFKKDIRLYTMKLAFTVKAYPFIKDKRREDYCNKITRFCNTLKGNYIKFNNYFIKYWKNAEIFNFTELDNSTIKNRTNNICESFHSKLNKEISHYHPKCSYLASELKRITIVYYNNYISTLSKNTKKRN